MGRVSTAVAAVALVVCAVGIQATSALLLPGIPAPSLGKTLVGGKLLATKKIVVAKGAKLIGASLLAPVLAKQVVKPFVGVAAKAALPVGKKLLPLLPFLKKPYVVAVPVYSKTVLNTEPRVDWPPAPWPSTAWPSAEAWPSSAWPSSYSTWALPPKTSSVWSPAGLGSGVYGGFAYGSSVAGQAAAYPFTSLSPKVAAAPSFAYGSSEAVQAPAYPFSSLSPKVAAAPSFESSVAAPAPTYSTSLFQAPKVAAAPSADPCPQGGPAAYGEGFADSVKQAAPAAPAVSYASYTVTKPLSGAAYSSLAKPAAPPAPVAQAFSSTPKLAVVSGYAAFASGGHGGGGWAYPNAPAAEWPSIYYKTKPQAALGQTVKL